MSRRAEIKQADANRIAKAAAHANVKAEIKLPSGVTVIFAPNTNGEAAQPAPVLRKLVI